MSRLRRAAAAVTAAAALALALAGCSHAEGRAAAAAAKVPAGHRLRPGPPPPPARPLIVAFVPHADDELLSMGVFIHDEVASGHDVRLVYYTDGAGNRLCAVDAAHVCAAHDRFGHQPMARFVADRDSELRHSARALGVPAADVLIYAPHGVRLHDGRGFVGYARTMIAYYHRRYPTATYLTMSWIDEHRDHASAGLALRDLVLAGTIPARQALFTMARWYWATPYAGGRPANRYRLLQQLLVDRGYPTATTLIRCRTAACRTAIHRAVLAYRTPAQGGTGYGIGWGTAGSKLAVLDRDPEVLLHTVATGRYPGRFALSGATVASGRTRWLSVHGRLSVSDFGRFGTNPDRPASAPYLAQTLLGRLVADPLPYGTRLRLTVIGAAGRVLAAASARLAGATFTARVDLPAGARRLVVQAPGSGGLAPVRGTWDLRLLGPGPGRGVLLLEPARAAP